MYVRVLGIIVILGTLLMLFLFWGTLNDINFPKSLGTFKMNNFLPTLLESHNIGNGFVYSNRMFHILRQVGYRNKKERKKEKKSI